MVGMNSEKRTILAMGILAFWLFSFAVGMGIGLYENVNHNDSHTVMMEEDYVQEMG